MCSNTHLNAKVKHFSLNLPKFSMQKPLFCFPGVCGTCQVPRVITTQSRITTCDTAIAALLTSPCPQPTLFYNSYVKQVSEAATNPGSFQAKIFSGQPNQTSITELTPLPLPNVPSQSIWMWATRSGPSVPIFLSQNDLSPISHPWRWHSGMNYGLTRPLETRYVWGDLSETFQCLKGSRNR